ncbi:MAG TPA: hypothetical protein VFO61_01435, partial [Alphaproteobacteria bacterium]|nr:hypothetical protein [Alphaproteobacteria bacterium]
ASGELHQVTGIDALAAMGNFQIFEQSLAGNNGDNGSAPSPQDDLNAFALGTDSMMPTDMSLNHTAPPEIMG